MKLQLATLVHELFKHGFIRPAMEIYEILYELTEGDDESEDNDASDAGSIANIVGLRGDVKPEEPMGGMTVNPFFMDVGDPF